MPEITTISAAIASVKNAFDIAKALNLADKTFERAEFKLEMSKLMEALFDAREKTLEVRDLLQEKEEKIAELKKALEFKGNLDRKLDGYYELDPNGEPYGAAYCSHCWEADNKAIHLYINFRREPVCPLCKTIYRYDRVSTIIMP
jgi:hypothetical protein